MYLSEDLSQTIFLLSKGFNTMVGCWILNRKNNNQSGNLAIIVVISFRSQLILLFYNYEHERKAKDICYHMWYQQRY